MTDLHCLQDGRLHAFLPGYATPDEELVIRTAAPLLSDQEPALGMGGGFNYALRTGRLVTDAELVGQFALSGARTRAGMIAQASLPPAEQITRIDLLDHEIANRQVRLTIQLVAGDRSRTVKFTLRTP